SLRARVLVIGHRGAPAWRPEHTLGSYARAIADGADFIEPDLVMTRDGELVARHENEIGTTTDVASHPGFVGRKITRKIDGHAVTGWFTEDFTLAELKTLRARERLPQLRGAKHDGEFQILTLEEIIDFAAAQSTLAGRPIGIIPEIKHGSYFQTIGLPMEDRLLATLAAHGYTRSAPVEIQSFEIANLQYLHDKLGTRHPNIRLLQLLDAADAQPYDVVAAGGNLDYAHMTTPAGLREIARYAAAIGPDLGAIMPRTAAERLGRPTRLVCDAHAAGLEVHAYTFRPENQFLAKEFWQGEDPCTFNRAGLIAQIDAYLDTGIDAFFTDDPASGRMAVDARSGARAAT
ncbi:MAG: glycerophosphodiester phosphodiesterase, partial [Rhodanobacter sp.]